MVCSLHAALSLSRYFSIFNASNWLTSAPAFQIFFLTFHRGTSFWCLLSMSWYFETRLIKAFVSVSPPYESPLACLPYFFYSTLVWSMYDVYAFSIHDLPVIELSIAWFRLIFKLSKWHLFQALFQYFFAFASFS